LRPHNERHTNSVQTPLKKIPASH